MSTPEYRVLGIDCASGRDVLTVGLYRVRPDRSLAMVTIKQGAAAKKLLSRARRGFIRRKIRN